MIIIIRLRSQDMLVSLKTNQSCPKKMQQQFKKYLLETNLAWTKKPTSTIA